MSQNNLQESGLSNSGRAIYKEVGLSSKFSSKLGSGSITGANRKMDYSQEE